MVMNAKRLLIVGCLLLALPVTAWEQTPAPGFIPSGAGSTNTSDGARDGLVNDGSFEDGNCAGGSAWTCTSSTGCEWIVDPLGAWGYPAYDGVNTAWLGGFCGDPNENSFCQDIYFDAIYLDWYWMGYVNSECSSVLVTVDGTPLVNYAMDLGDHTYGSWNSASGWIVGPDGLDVSAYFGGTHQLCFEWDRGLCGAGENDNMLIDYVGLWGPPLPTELTVNPDGSGDVPTIQDAIDLIAPGGTVYLGDGVFTGTGNHNLNAWGKDLTLRSLSLNPETCTIDCEGVPPAPRIGRPQTPVNSSGPHLFPENDRIPLRIAMYIVSGESSAFTVEGISFTRGWNWDWYGGAIYIYGSAPTITNCIFYENTADGYGGGAIAGEVSSPTIQGCTFFHNTAFWGGAVEILAPGSNAIIEDCYFYENLALYDGGALNVYDGAVVDVQFCRFLRNTTMQVGGAVSHYWGGSEPFADFRWCTFSENTADIGGSAIWADAPFRSWFNIFSFGQSGAAFLWTGGATHPEFACTNIFGNVGGDWTDILAPMLGVDGNISMDPQYCGPIGSGDLELQSDSPCLAANNDCGQQIGALPQGCEDTVARTSSWSEVKSLY